LFPARYRGKNDTQGNNAMTNARIFIVEDDDIIAKTTEWRLKKLGYEVSGRAVNGKDAVEAITRDLPDLVLMDISLPGDMDGITAAGIIRKTSNLPIVYMTARSDDETLHLAKATRPSGYLVKPFEDKDLRVAIEMALDK
jgi:two-component system, response regulator PdtaR